jgi:tetratricopeptide (TPR) repeat protein
MSLRPLPVLLLVLLSACARSRAPLTFDDASARAALEGFLAAEGYDARLAYVAAPVAARLRALPVPPQAPALAVPGSLLLDEVVRRPDRVVYRAAWQEQRGPDVRPARGWFTLVDEGGRPRLLWRAPLVDEAWALVGRGQFELARERFGALLAEDDHDPVLLDRAGWAALRISAVAEAEALFEREAKLDPRAATPLASLAAVRVRQDRLAEAEGLLREAVARESTVEALSNLGEVLRRQQRLDEAVAVLGDAHRTDRAHPGPLLFLAELHRQLGHVPECAAAADQAWPTRDQLEAFAWERLAAVRAACLFLDRRLDEARTTTDELLRRSPSSPTTRKLVDFLREQGATFVAPPAP